MIPIEEVISWKFPNAETVIRTAPNSQPVIERWVHPTEPKPTLAVVNGWRTEYLAAGAGKERETDRLFASREFKIILRLIQQLHGLTRAQIRARIRTIVGGL